MLDLQVSSKQHNRANGHWMKNIKEIKIFIELYLLPSVGIRV
mgnify:CR=1 FL=1